MEREQQVIHENERRRKREADLEAMHAKKRKQVTLIKTASEENAQQVEQPLHIREVTNDERKVLDWMTSITNAWTETTTTTDEAELKVIKQTTLSLKPLRKRLKLGLLQPDILDKLLKIIEHCEGRKYKEAHDIYLLLAIGNSPWPLGVKGLINQRSEAVASAHILNDETTRMYMQSFKRLISRCQKLYPADNPSEMITLGS